MAIASASARRTFEFLDTPGHARHHYCAHDLDHDDIFSGDTFGISYREFDTAAGPFVFPTTTPVQFDPEALQGVGGPAHVTSGRGAWCSRISGRSAIWSG